MTYRMPRREADFKFVRAELQLHPMHKINGRLGTRVNVKAEERSPSACAPQDMVVRMQHHQRQRVQRIRDRARPANVIEMRVCVPEMTDTPAALLRLCQNNMTVPGWVDDRGFCGFWIGNQIGGRLGGTSCEGNDLKHGQPSVT